ncbi:AraC-like DNA-binding protein [Nocardioides zeae]|uniref:HTH-type transcriptional regulator RipA n=2 Tax=Nocardioides zeae TaxID=1457234 RepID=A0AAJ1X324_9ACTN|nr:AraC family transcriptional regulator [Nocardioides zeae]MDQ1105189.1 AraC-like DNA-binding protein [Nocardioides zeae]MDR6175096.1 AraC-like DNA-binding protein [Nocardioides zeae]MDR6211674.1 AraC-like DNA-binding protein [Nocardioides zeae]
MSVAVEEPTATDEVRACVRAVPDGYLMTTLDVHLPDDAEPDRCGADPHTHPEHVVLWPEQGSTTVEVDGLSWRLSLGQGLWLPSGTVHAALRSPGSPANCTHVLPEAWSAWSGSAGAPATGRGPRPVAVNLALRELLLHLAEQDMPREQRLRAQRVCFELLAEEGEHALRLPVPRDPRILAVARAILADPADDRSIEDWAWRTSMSARTIARAFRSDTGMTFTQWRTCARMSAAVELLGSGATVGQVAHRVGYSTVSAFTAAFRRTVGSPPHHYLRSGAPRPR